MVKALLDFKPDWFQSMANAIRAENKLPGNLRHAQGVAGNPRGAENHRADLIYPENATGEAAPPKPRYTIAELCAILKTECRRPVNQEEAECSAPSAGHVMKPSFPICRASRGDARKNPEP